MDWEHTFDERSPVYLQISKKNLILHLTEHHGDGCPGSTVFVWMKGIEAFHATITSRGYGYMRPGIEMTFYNSPVIEVTDLFGNRIRFNEDLTDRAESRAQPVALLQVSILGQDGHFCPSQVCRTRMSNLQSASR